MWFEMEGKNWSKERLMVNHVDPVITICLMLSESCPFGINMNEGQNEIVTMEICPHLHQQNDKRLPV